MDVERLSPPYNLQGKRIWVAGHRGMVGAALSRRLLSEQCEILTVGKSELDLRDQQAVLQWLGRNKPEAVIIAAAKVGGIIANASAPAPFLYDNLMIEANIIQGSFQAGVERLLFLGSSCIYPRECKQPIREEYLLSGPLEPTNEAYAIAKIAGLKLVEFYNRQYGCDYISAMPCNLYGAGDMYDLNNSHVIPALIMKIHKAKIENSPVATIWGTGEPLREFLEVDELADALIFIMKHYKGAMPINVGSGHEISIRDLAEMICEVVGYNGKLKFNASMPDGAPRKLLDISRLTTMGWKSKMCLNNGLNMAYKDFLGRYGNDSSAGHNPGRDGWRATG